MRLPWACLIALALAVALAAVAVTPPRPRPTDAPAAEFSAERAMADVRAIARAPHPAGSAEDARVRDLLAARLAGLGAQIRMAPFPLARVGAERSAKWSGRPAPAQIVDVVGVTPGRDRSAPAVLLMAHHDTVWASPGAADDTAGVASALEIVRALRAGPPPARDLVVLFTDGEELGLEGAKGFFASDPERGRVGAVVNLESRGGGGRVSMFETGRADGDMMRLFASRVRRPSATSLSSYVYTLLPNSTDFTPAKAAGVAGVNFAFIGRPELYHSPLATPERLDRGALQDMGAQGLDIVRALTAAPQLPARAPDIVYFDVFGLFMVHYPPVWGWAVLAAAAALLGLAAARSDEPARQAAAAVAVSLALTVGAGALLWAANRLSGAGHGANYYDRLAAIPLLMVQASLLCAAVLAGALGWLRRSAGDGARGAAGLAAAPLLLGVALQAVAPATAFQVAWPLLLAGVAAAAVAGGRVGLWRTALAVVAAAVGVGQLFGESFYLFQAVGPDLPSAMAVPLGLAACLLAPLVPRMRTSAVGLAAAGLTLVALAIAVDVRLAPLAPSVPPYSLKR